MRDDILYEVTADLDGRQGMLQLRVHGRLRTEDRQQIVLAHSILAFGQDCEGMTRQIVVDPARYLAQVGTGVPPQTTINVQIYLVWRPDDGSSELQGRVKLERTLVSRQAFE